MIRKENLNQIKEITRTFFQKTTIPFEMVIPSPEDETLSIDLKVEEPRILIGEQGQTLLEIQHLLKIILRKQTEEKFFVNLDINNYKKKKAEYLKELAHSVADEVSLTKRERTLAPMPAYERRIIHLELAEREDVTTESIGQEPKRRVVVRAYP